MRSLYVRFCERSLPADVQKAIEGFASMSDSVEEKFFRAGFKCRKMLKEIFSDPNNPAIVEDFILVRKEDINLDWYKKIKAEIAKESK